MNTIKENGTYACNIHWTIGKEKAVGGLFAKTVNEFLKLPSLIKVPDGMSEESEISEWLFDKFRFRQKSFAVVCK